MVTLCGYKLAIHWQNFMELYLAWPNILQKVLGGYFCWLTLYIWVYNDLNIRVCMIVFRVATVHVPMTTSFVQYYTWPAIRVFVTLPRYSYRYWRDVTNFSHHRLQQPLGQTWQRNFLENRHDGQWRHCFMILLAISLKQLHWLPLTVEQRIRPTYKLYLFMHYIHIGLAPKYLSDRVSTVSAASGR